MSHVISDLVYKAYIKQSPLEIMGDGLQKRTFTHVDDFSRAISLMVKKKVVNEDFNICGNETISVREIASRVWKMVNPGMAFPAFKHLKAPKEDVRFRKSSTEKARKLLGWKPMYNTDDILRDSIKVIAEIPSLKAKAVSAGK